MRIVVAHVAGLIALSASALASDVVIEPAMLETSEGRALVVELFEQAARDLCQGAEETSLANSSCYEQLAEEFADLSDEDIAAKLTIAFKGL